MVGARPASEFSQKAITEALQPYATGPIISTFLDGYRDRAEKGLHVVGHRPEVWAEVASPTNPDGTTSIEVTICRDQRAVEVLDEKGKVQPDEYPDFLSRRWEMRKVEGVFKVWQGDTLAESCDR